MSAAMTVPRSESRLAAGVRWFVHLLLYGLSGIVGLLLLARSEPGAGPAVAVLVLLVSVYSLGARFSVERPQDPAPSASPQSLTGVHPRRSLLTLLLTLALWLVLCVLTPQGVWIAFALFFAVLMLPSRILGITLLFLVALVAGFAPALHTTETAVLGPGQVLGPFIGALVALGIMSTLRTLQKEIAVRELITRELRTTRAQLARTERDAGIAQERERIARDLHDTVAQSTISISMLLESAQRAAADSDTARLGELLESALDMTRQTTRQTRQFVDAGAPSAAPVDEDPAAVLCLELQQLVDQHQLTTSARIVLRCDLSASDSAPGISAEPDARPAIRQSAAQTLVRVAASLLANAVQHARADTIVVTVGQHEGELMLDVVDDGAGIPTGRDEGFGLRTVRARVKSAGGTATVETAPGHGTAVSVTVPA